MRRSVTLAGIALVAVLAFGLYKLKYEVQELEDRYGAMNRAILSEQEAIRVLRAEWSFLNSPKRLGDLTKRYLKLKPVSVDRFIRLEEIPIARPGSAGGEHADTGRLTVRLMPEGGN